MPELLKGGNTVVGAGALSAELHTVGDQVDLSALLVGADGRVRSDGDLVFYNQPSAEGGAVRHVGADASGPERVVVEPGGLPADVDRVVLVASCDPDNTARTFRDVKEVTVRAQQAGGEAVVFHAPALTDGERAVLLMELYRRGDGWKLRAIGQGYAEGLAGLATDFGIDVSEPEPAAPPQPALAPAPPVAPLQPAPAPAPPAPAPADLTKPPLGRISLDKGSQVSLSLDKKDRELVVTVALEWDGGSDERRRRGADLDLYALFVPAGQAQRGTQAPGTIVKTGRGEKKGKGGVGDVVYYKNLGSLQQAPYIQLDGDARVPGRETVRIVRPEEQGYVLLCAYSAVSNGFGSFKSFGAKVVVDDGRGSVVTVPLYENTKTRYWVAIALVDFTAPDGAAVQHIESYSGRMNERRPVLHPDGTIEMNAGPVEFKRRSDSQS
ncbi:TerD family protein [Streptomyces sp. S.PB5]|uniref:TerD family protein n=1 Tax=Streptomyces sp. S.PB5 TaxID=3020844 RepID=UPI0025AFDEBF|nr:TerD family protein [Streptomyces sp. S.PB5]MDN3020432.1 TerD family protein [Streptomyces sp. S.PB5]